MGKYSAKQSEGVGLLTICLRSSCSNEDAAQTPPKSMNYPIDNSKPPGSMVDVLI